MGNKSINGHSEIKYWRKFRNNFFLNLILSLEIKHQKKLKNKNYRWKFGNEILKKIFKNGINIFLKLWKSITNENLETTEFWMRHTLFLQILQSVCAHDSYFLQKRDALSLSLIQKCICCIVHFSLHNDTWCGVHEYYWIGESMAIQTMKRFVKVVKEIFETKYSK